MNALAAGTIAFSAFVIGWLAIRKLVIEKAEVNSLTINDLIVKRLHAREIVMCDPLPLPEAKFDS